MSDPNLPPPPGEGNQPPPPPGGGAPPPPPGGYGAPPPGGGQVPPAQPYQAGGQPPFEVGAAISYGWKKFTENVGPFIILMLVVFLAYIVINVVGTVLTPDSTGLLALVWSMFISALTIIVGFIVQAGVLRAALGVTRGEKPSVEMLTRTDNLVPYALTVILVGIGAFIGLILCILPGIIWIIFTWFAQFEALDKGTSPVESIKKSISWVTDDLGRVLGLLIVAWLVYMVGIVACFVGILVSAPVALVAIAYAYRLLNNEPVAP